METTIQGQSNSLIELITTLQTSTNNLEEKQKSQIDKIGSKLTEFVIQFDLHSQLPIPEFASYLNHDVLSPLTVVMGYAELFRTIYTASLTEHQLAIIVRVCDIAQQLIDNILELRNEMVAKRQAMAQTV